MIQKEMERLGYGRDDDPDEVIRKRFNEVPSWLQEELIKVGFKVYDVKS